MQNLPLFFAVVICAPIARLDTKMVNAYCGAFLGSRAAHAKLYFIVTDKVSTVRSTVWMASVECCLYLLIEARTFLSIAVVQGQFCC